MQNLDRNSMNDAQRVINEFLYNESIKQIVLPFLTNAILYANSLDPSNWNLNLDRNGKFIRFNVGQEYCIQLNPKYILILVLKRNIYRTKIENYPNITFIGYRKKKKIYSSNFEGVPDCLAKIDDSLGCEIVYDKNISEIIPIIEDANYNFIEEATKRTKIHPLMIRAHSKGCVAYLSQEWNQKIINPSYKNDDSQDDSITNPFTETENYGSSYKDLCKTDQQIVILSRIGQEKFRASLVSYWGKCAVTGCKKLELLRASHIKPWNEASDKERLDKYNGLLLIPNLDAAFDAGFISFDDDGRIMISNVLSNDDRDRLGINPQLCLSKVFEQHKKYLTYHRKYIFKDNQ
jgi:5-methylcytosine-specific restriction protein A